MNKLSESLALILGGISLIFLIALLMAFPTMLLWNSCLVPAVNGVNEINFFQALGINFLFSILFKSSSSSNSKKNG